MSDYRGITYPTIRWNWPRFFYKLWRRWCCTRECHLWSEVYAGGAGWTASHYLVCDACQLMVHIEKIDDKYVEKR